MRLTPVWEPAYEGWTRRSLGAKRFDAVERLGDLVLGVQLKEGIKVAA
ncbi:MAG: hypothetical protein IT198_16115 [Acidimicrobiia bacterium]|nr:hypothetical protein [Acidimicrobiia bacterium]